MKDWLRKMVSRAQEKQWERQSGLAYHLAMLLKNPSVGDETKKQLHEHLVLRIAHDLINAQHQLELMWCMVTATQTFGITKNAEFMKDVLCYYIRATHPFLEQHKPPQPISWDELEKQYLRKEIA